MKRTLLTLIALIIFIQVGNCQSSKITKHALIFAIGDYPTDSTGWPKISSANDAVLMRDALDFQGFEDITVVQDTAATKQGIIKNIKTFTDGMLEGDFAVIHFSCHGQLLEDDNGDESDGYDEALVPFDAPCGKGKFAPIDYKGEKHFRDDELALLILDIRKKLGPKGDLVLTLDANHSGSSVYGTAKCRGNMPAYKYSSKIINSVVGDNEVFNFKDQDDESLAAYLVLTASRPNENNTELSKYECGSFSFAISKAFKDCEKGITYTNLFTKIQSIMNFLMPGQTPTIEGNTDSKVFNGEIIPQQAYITIYDVIDDRTILINAGKLSGLADSTKISLYPNATYDTKGKTPVATGMIISSDITTSKVILNRDLRINNKANKWIYVTHRSFDDQHINVKSEDLKNAGLNTFVYNDLHANKLTNVVLDSTSELLVTLAKAKGSTLLDITNSINGTILKNNLVKENLDKTISAYIQGKFLKELKFNNPDYRIEIEIIPVKKGSFEPLNINDFTNKGVISFDTNCQFIFRAKNTGKLPCYFSIIEIKPDGKVSTVVPSNDAQYSGFGPDYFNLKAGATKDIEIRMSVHQPYGTVIYKIIASGQLIDLKSITNNQGLEKREGETIFEKLFRESYNNPGNFEKRGTKPKAVPADIGVTTSNYPVIIKKLK